jgi:predicted HTH domain antitoxin
MTVTLDIPDAIFETLPDAPDARPARLLLEMATGLYAKGTLSLAQGAELASLSRIDFGWELGERGIPRHYGPSELSEDIAYAERTGRQ